MDGIERMKLKKICIIMSYRMCQTRGTISSLQDSTTAHYQQVHAMIKQGYSDPDLQNQALADLSKLIANKRKECCKIVLMIDANKSIVRRKGQNGTSSWTLISQMTFIRPNVKKFHQ